MKAKILKYVDDIEKVPDQAGVVYDFSPVVASLKQILVAVRAQKPTTRATVTGAQKLTQNNAETYKFELDGKPVPALKVLITNTSGQSLFIGLGEPADPGGIILASGSSMNINDVALGYISLMQTSVASVSVNGVDNQGRTPNAVNIDVWTNPEFSDIWGMI